MNESTLTQLKIIVERAVRPVRASLHQKRKMREELLAHVAGVFEEETQHGGEAIALARTQERFGPPDELTAQLQASLPGSDRIFRFIEHLQDFRPGESILRRATRNAVIISVIFGAAVLVPFIVRNRFSEWSIIPAAGVMMFGFTFMTHWMREALHGPAGRSWLRVCLVGIASGFLIPGVTFGVCLIYTGQAWSSLMSVSPMVPLSLLLAWAPVAITAHMSALELRYRREWDSLAIGS